MGIVAGHCGRTRCLPTGRPVQLTLVDRDRWRVMDQPGRRHLRFPLKLLFLGDNVDATRISQIIESLCGSSGSRPWRLRTRATRPSSGSGSSWPSTSARNALVISASEENYRGDRCRSACEARYRLGQADRPDSDHQLLRTPQPATWQSPRSRSFGSARPTCGKEGDMSRRTCR